MSEVNVSNGTKENISWENMWVPLHLAVLDHISRTTSVIWIFYKGQGVITSIFGIFANNDGVVVCVPFSRKQHYSSVLLVGKPISPRLASLVT